MLLVLGHGDEDPILRIIPVTIIFQQLYGTWFSLALNECAFSDRPFSDLEQEVVEPIPTKEDPEQKGQFLFRFNIDFLILSSR